MSRNIQDEMRRWRTREAARKMTASFGGMTRAAEWLADSLYVAGQQVGLLGRALPRDLDLDGLS